MVEKTQKKGIILVDVEELEDEVEVQDEAYTIEEVITALKRMTTKFRDVGGHGRGRFDGNRWKLQIQCFNFKKYGHTASDFCKYSNSS